VPGRGRGHGHAADGLRVGLRHPAAQGDDDDGGGHAAALHLGDKGFSPPVGEAYAAVEHPKGENGYYFVSDGTPLPYRFRIRSPDFVNLSVLPYLAEGAMLADVVALIGTIDIVLGSVDR
jgi:NADH:ubiquinone oxidoreductase subunit D